MQIAQELLNTSLLHDVGQWVPSSVFLGSIEDKLVLQVDRYKGLLVKQRDIMTGLTGRLNERDEQILRLQEELEAYDSHQKCATLPALHFTVCSNISCHMKQDILSGLLHCKA